MTDEERPWTFQEAADWFSRDVVTIRRWVRLGKLDAIAAGGLITAESVRRLSTTPVRSTDRGHDGRRHPDLGSEVLTRPARHERP